MVTRQHGNVVARNFLNVQLIAYKPLPAQIGFQITNGTLLGDANDDGFVSGLDLISIQENFGKALPTAAPLPESGTLTALGLGVLALLRRPDQGTKGTLHPNPIDHEILGGKQ